MSRFWPVAESAQADYEALRDAVLATGALPDDVASARFCRRGLAGLIAWPAAEPVFVAELRGATRPPWSPYADPRLEALAAAYRLLLAKDPTELAAIKVCCWPWNAAKHEGRAAHLGLAIQQPGNRSSA